MATLKLQPAPTWWCKVDIPQPGGEPLQVSFEFKHMNKEELEKHQTVGVVADAKAIMAIAVNWKDVDGEFNEENIALLLKNYHGAGRAIARTFVSELMQVKLGN